MRMDIENSPGAQAGLAGRRRAIIVGQRLVRRWRDVRKLPLLHVAIAIIVANDAPPRLVAEQASGVLWRHAASTLNAADPMDAARLRLPKLGRAVSG